MTDSNNRLDRMESLLQETIQITRSNAKSIESLSAETAANRLDIATTRASVDGLVQIITEFSTRSEVRLNKLDDAIAGINATNERLELILRRLVQE